MESISRHTTYQFVQPGSGDSITIMKKFHFHLASAGNLVSNRIRRDTTSPINRLPRTGEECLSTASREQLAAFTAVFQETE